jgi:hypothetical protein
MRDDGEASDSWSRTAQDAAEAESPDPGPDPTIIDPRRRQVRRDKLVALLLILVAVAVILWFTTHQVVGD